MVSTIGVAENDDSEPFDSILQIGHRFLGNGFNKNFKVRVSKCRFNERHQKTR